jgi:hypothetical protein
METLAAIKKPSSLDAASAAAKASISSHTFSPTSAAGGAGDTCFCLLPGMTLARARATSTSKRERRRKRALNAVVLYKLPVTRPMTGAGAGSDLFASLSLRAWQRGTLSETILYDCQVPGPTVPPELTGLALPSPNCQPPPATGCRLRSCVFEFPIVLSRTIFERASD